MKPGEHRYAVAIRHGSELRLTLWVRRSRKGEFFVIMPRPAPWDPHTSYHCDGTIHMKDHGMVAFSHTRKHDRKLRKLQRLDGPFRGVEHLGHYYGHSKRAGDIISDRGLFSGIVEVESDVVVEHDPQRSFGVAVELVEPGHEPPEAPWFRIVKREVFQDVVPWVVITPGVFEDVLPLVSAVPS
jgi:hypothetical protein